MKRNLEELSNTKFDVLVIGGGIYGACVAYEATLRGLSVALVEKQDFCGATSANSLKTIHGGLRYLQHADLKRMRESIYERRTLMKIAPHLVHPLPVLVPTYGHGLKGIEAMTVALKINDLVSCDRNLGLSDPQKQIPAGRTLSPAECLTTLPGISADGLTGGAIFHDAQVYNSERLVLAYLQSATQLGLQAANYLEVTNFLQTGHTICGVQVTDALTANTFDIQAKAIINTSGPWINNVLKLLKQPPSSHQPFALAMNLVTRSLFDHDYAVGIYSKADYTDEDAILKRKNRLLFIAPWQGCSLVGTTYSHYADTPDHLSVPQHEIQHFLDDINHAYPPANLTAQDVYWVHQGLLPSSHSPATTPVQLTKHYHIQNYQEEGLNGLISVTGVKYTTARNVAIHAVDTAATMLNRPVLPSQSAQQPLHGGAIDNLDDFLNQGHNQLSRIPDHPSVQHFLYNYGTAYSSVLKQVQHGQRATPRLDLLQAQVTYAIEEEMAQTLSDVIFRRTGIGAAQKPTTAELQTCADVMSNTLLWSQSRVEQEISEVTSRWSWSSPKPPSVGEKTATIQGI